MTIYSIFVVILLSANCSALFESQIRALYTSTSTGDGTYYGAGGEFQGTCQLAPSTAIYKNVDAAVAMATNKFFGSFACGMCIKVTASGKGLGLTPLARQSTVYVMDQCPSCPGLDLDYALNGDGRWDITWQAIPCPVGNAKLEYKFQGSHEWYIKLQIRNERYPVTQAYANHDKTNGQWTPLARTSDGFWTQPNTQFRPIKTPIQLKLVAFNGKTIYDSVGQLRNDVVIRGSGVQFPEDRTLG